MLAANIKVERLAITFILVFLLLIHYHIHHFPQALFQQRYQKCNKSLKRRTIRVF